jgi:hypothetical protein
VRICLFVCAEVDSASMTDYEHMRVLSRAGPHTHTIASIRPNVGETLGVT